MVKSIYLTIGYIIIIISGNFILQDLKVKKIPTKNYIYVLKVKYTILIIIKYL